MAEKIPHCPVMVEETLEFLRPRRGIFVDATVGYGGHAEGLLEAGGPDLRLVGIDRDAEALGFTRDRLFSFADQVTLVKENFSELSSVLDRLGVERIDGALFDLGMSSPQLDRADRGFGWTHPGPLDMRMDRDQEKTAAALVNELSEGELQKVLETFGEERFARRIARRIVQARRKSPVRTTAELAALVASAIPTRLWSRKRHPATRTFQALRIAVNDELDTLPKALEAAIHRLSPGKRLVVLSYHSLEDRIVKQTFQRLAAGRRPEGGIEMPPWTPFGEPTGPRILQILTKSPLRPSEGEIRENPRSRSACLRCAERRENG
ncbi:MAG: 16S rRNA (cytosine(1402)-N(4))-methyltransferase RsmH [Nitrospinota bacterium]